MGVELYLAVVAKSSMLANLTPTDIVLLHAHTTHTHTRTHTHTHTHTQGNTHTNTHTHNTHTHTHTHTWPCHIASLIHLHAWGRLNFFTPAKNNIGLNYNSLILSRPLGPSLKITPICHGSFLKMQIKINKGAHV